jgi:hypothetical protein
LRKEVADADEWCACFSGTADFAFKNLVERDFAIEHLIEVQTIHADDALAASEGDETVLGEAAVADKEATGPGRFLLDFAVERVQLGNADRLAVPFGLDKVDLASELEATVDLFSAQTEGLLRGQAEGVEQAFEETLERIAARVWRQRRDLEKVRLDLDDRRAVDGYGLRACRPALLPGATREAVDQASVACLGVRDRVSAAGTGEILAAMFPERF